MKQLSAISHLLPYLSLLTKKIKHYNYKKLYETSKLATKNLDQVIDINFYPTEKTKKSNNLTPTNWAWHTRFSRCIFYITNSL